MTAMNRFCLLIAFSAFIAAPLAAQSPNTATMIIVAVDQAGAVVKDAKVSVMNTATLPPLNVAGLPGVEVVRT